MKKIYLIIALVFALTFISNAQSGRTPSPTPTPTPEIVSSKKPENLEKHKVVLVKGFNNFIKTLNDLGKIGYRLDKSLNYGNEGVSQSFVAFLKLDENNAYEYDWLSSPNKNFLEIRLNAKAEKGFRFVTAFALSVCDSDKPETDSESSTTGISFPQTLKSDAFLLERRIGDTTKSKNYKVVIGKIGLGKNPTQVLQTAIDNASQDSTPVKILFNREGLANFAVSLLFERDLNQSSKTIKTQYKFVKETSGFEKEINLLAMQGYRFLSGRRIALVKFALLAKNSEIPTTYTFIDKEKYAKEFEKTLVAGNIFTDVMNGDYECDSYKVINEKFIFEKNDKNMAHKIVKLDETNENIANVELTKLWNDGFEIRSFFYSDSLFVILTKDDK